MKLVIISDTHCKLSKIDLPDGDILLHCGDATFTGSVKEIEEFNHDLQFVKHRYKHGVLFCPGNHDWLFETRPERAKELLSNAKVLIDEEVVIDGIKFYGSPWQPAFCNWAFNLPRGEQLATKWKNIPNDVNVLLTHGPPFDILDVVPRGAEKVGCQDLRIRVDELKDLKLHCFGHIHHSYGQIEIDGKKYVNAAICNEMYEPLNKPFVIDI